MDNDIKNSYLFKATNDIENIIENWAKSSDFTETSLPKQLDENDITYCFVLDNNGEKTLLTINILDDTVYIETWVMASSDRNKIATDQMNTLLNRIKDMGEN